VRVFVLGSGSSGNCLVAEVDGARIVIDAGLNPTRAAERMRSLGEDLILGAGAPLGLFVTHEHGDHSGHTLPLARALRAPVYAHERAALGRVRRRTEVRAYVPGRRTVIGPFEVDALPIPHDAPQVALRVAANGRSFAIVTDLGHVTRELRAVLGHCDLVLVEANHCRELLDLGLYPMHLKRRVAGPLGHLANEQTAELARSLEDTRVSQLVLVHLSQMNNSPGKARDVVTSRVRRLPVDVLPQAEARCFTVGAGPRRSEQLALAF
jgi:phosphoribosyl 1,2-cyclic phosphodiesterase